METERQLIQSILEGDTSAFRRLVEAHQSYVYSVCYSVVKNKAIAEEAAQDTFIKVYRSLKKYKSESKLTSWMYSIAYRTSLDYIRKQKKTEALDSVDYMVSDPSMNTQENLEADEFSVLVKRMVNKLPPEDAALIRMFYFEDMSVQELADIAGISVSNVKVRLFRIRKKLHNFFQDSNIVLEEY